MKSERSQPHFQLSEQELQRLIEKVQKVQMGDSRQKVESLLGKPWSDNLVRRKENNNPIGRFVTYYVIKQDKELVNEGTDRLVIFRFDMKDHLVKIISKVPAIKSRP